MIDLARLRHVIAGISFGAFRPAMTLEVTTKVTVEAERPAVLIGIDARDVEDQDGPPIRLYECHAAPDLDDRALAIWVRDRCQDIILHEMDEFFRYKGEPVVTAVHPVSEDVYTAVRARR